MSEVTMAQEMDWGGASAEVWLAHQVRLSRMLESYGEVALAAAAAQNGERVIDVGCGTGITSHALAERVGGAGDVLGVDISALLLARAEADPRKGMGARFQLGDAATIDLPSAAFDLLFSRFGVMFFDDPFAAFAHLRPTLKPGGRLAFICWRAVQENDWIRIPMAAIRDIVPLPPFDSTTPGPFSFADRARVESILTDAGFVDIVIAPVDKPMLYGDGATRAQAIDDALDLTMTLGPVARALAGQPDDIRARATAAVRTAFSAVPGGASLLLGGAAWMVTARNPIP